MKRMFRKIGFMSLMAMVSSGAFAASAQLVSESGICNLVAEMQGVFRILRTLAFVGAAFTIAGWAWGYISKPGDAKIDNIKEKGQGLLVGTVLLFGVGIILQLLTSVAGQGALGCNITSGW